ncbi:MAG: hypothetical protein D3908_00315, partial [Candidatus Electrothrix sp. AUS4]|nr:hypothetical protein [Candidatus Electrothrix sp. AUS4]
MSIFSSLPTEVVWPATSLHQALPLLARMCSLVPSEARNTPDPLPEESATVELVGHWLLAAARQMGLEPLAIETSYPEADEMLSQAGPAFLYLPGEGPAKFLAIVRGGRRTIQLLGSNGEQYRLPLSQVRDALTAKLEEPVLPSIEGMMQHIGVQNRRRTQVRRALLCEHLATARIGGCWMLRLPPGASFRQ